MVTTLKNDYYLCWPDRYESWTPDTDHPHPHWIRTRYFSRVFIHMEAHLNLSNLTIYLTSDIHKLPSYGGDVVAVLQEDEPSRVPHYFHRVLATFTCYGIQQSLRPNPLLNPSYENLLSGASHVYNLLRRTPGLIRRKALQYIRSENLPPIHTIPLGYANQVDLPVKPILDRPTDLFFAGSVSHRQNEENILRRTVGSAKYVSRKKLVRALRRLEQSRPALNVDVQTRTSFSDSIHASAQSYSQRMMAAKICPIPRGTSLESFRFFEAMRAGCIPIVEGLPTRRYYDGAPALTIRRWTDLMTVVPRLLADDSRLQRRHEAIQEWWKTHCSEEVVGKYMAKRLNALDSSH